MMSATVCKDLMFYETADGLVIASVTNTMQETQVLNQLLWLPLIFLSGATFPLAYLPKKPSLAISARMPTNVV